MQKYKIVLHLAVEMELPLAKSEVNEKLARLVKSLTSGTPVSVTKYSVEGVKQVHKIERLGEFRPDDVLPHVGIDRSHAFTADNGTTYNVKMNSQRYFVFRDSLKCVACGIEGTRMFLERHTPTNSPHFNLYAEEDGKLIMMTKDHIKPKHKGGQDHHSNYQTMCAVCNGIKGCTPMTLDTIRRLREVLRVNQSLPKKTLSKLMQTERDRLMEGCDPEKAKKAEKKAAKKARKKEKKDKEVGVVVGLMYTTLDLNLYEVSEGDLWGYGVYSKVDSSCGHVACVRKKTPVDAVAQDGEAVLVRLKDGIEFRTWLRNLSQTK